MTQSYTTTYSDLEQKYHSMSLDSYKNFTKYILAGIIAILVLETGRTMINCNLSMAITYILMISAAGVCFRWIWARKSTHEIAITLFYVILFNIGLIVEYKKKARFSSIYETFFFSYGYSLGERLMVERMSNMKHRIFFTMFAFAVRIMLFPEAEFATYIKQAWLLFVTILVGMFGEKRLKEFFFSHCNSQEQLTKFKNLVVEHIPEAIVIVSQDLTRSCFVNNSFLNLVQGTTSDLQSQLKSFLLKEEIESRQNIESLSTDLHLGNTLLDFIRTSSLDDGASCIVTSYKKRDIDNLDDNDTEKRVCRLFEVKLSKIIWDDQPCIAIILHDVTGHHTILSLKIADAQKDKVLATVSHELKTPLNGMLGMIQVMEKKIKDTELLRFLTICKSSTTLLVSLVCSILDLNQIRADKMKLNKENIDVKRLVKDVLSLFEYQCQQKGIYLTTRIEPGTPNLLYTDKDRLSQVLINLIGNAQKFTSRGGIMINVSKGKEENSVRFSVEDTGIGISKQDQEKLFQVYGKLSQEDDRINRHGVGLGLTIAESLVKALNNSKKEGREISIKSEQGRGSKFSFTVRSASSERCEPIYLLETESENLPTVPNETEELLTLYESAL